MAKTSSIKTKSAAQKELDKAKDKLAARKAEGKSSPKLQSRIQDLKGVKRSINSVPKVNPDPRPPNEPKPSVSKGGFATVPPATPQNPLGTSPAPLDGGSGGSQQGSNAVPPPNDSLGGASSWTGEGPDPRDAQYWLDVGRALSNAQLSKVDYGIIPANYVAGGMDHDLTRRQALQDQILNFRGETENRGIERGAAKRGAFYSSETYEDQQRARFAREAERAGLHLELADIDAMRDAALLAVEAGFSQEELMALFEAGGRLPEPTPDPVAPPGGGGGGGGSGGGGGKKGGGIITMPGFEPERFVGQKPAAVTVSAPKKPTTVKAKTQAKISALHDKIQVAKDKGQDAKVDKLKKERQALKKKIGK